VTPRADLFRVFRVCAFVFFVPVAFVYFVFLAFVIFVPAFVINCFP